MKIVPCKPFEELDEFHRFKDAHSMHRDMKRILGSTTGEHQLANNLEGEWLPLVELSETKDCLIIKAELPGLEEKDVEVTISGDILTIAGEKKQERKDDKEKEHYHYTETFYGSFRRSFHLQTGIKADKVDAHFDKGILKITLPKTEETKKIEIKVKVK
jgi:HSP20 family protein